MKDTNRPLTYEVSIRLLIFLLVLFIGCVSTYVFFIKGYYSLYQDNQKLEQITRSLKTETGILQSTINRLNKERLAKEVEGEEPMLTGLDQDTLKSSNIVAIQELKLETDQDAAKLSFSFTLDKAGIIIERRRAIIAITTNNSISVNAFL